MRPLCLGCNTTCMCGCGGDLWPGAFFSLCLGCMCGCGGDNGGGVRVPRPLFLVPPAPLPHSQLQLFLSLCVPHSQTKPNQVRLPQNTSHLHSYLNLPNFVKLSKSSAQDVRNALPPVERLSRKHQKYI